LLTKVVAKEPHPNNYVKEQKKTVLSTHEFRISILELETHELRRTVSTGKKANR
jgi:hypothetical protein